MYCGDGNSIILFQLDEYREIWRSDAGNLTNTPVRQHPLRTSACTTSFIVVRSELEPAAD